MNGLKHTFLRILPMMALVAGCSESADSDSSDNEMADATTMSEPMSDATGTGTTAMMETETMAVEPSTTTGEGETTGDSSGSEESTGSASNDPDSSSTGETGGTATGGDPGLDDVNVPHPGDSCADETDLACGAGESCCTVYEVAAGTVLFGRSPEDDDGFPEVIDGSSYDDELPEVEIALSGFAMDKYEVTVSRYQAFLAAYTERDMQALVDAGAGSHPSDVAGTTWQGALPANAEELTPTSGTIADPAGRTNLPMNTISWADAYLFCAWDGGRLPTLAEFEFAAAGPEDRLYPWGDSAPFNESGRPLASINTSQSSPIPVGSSSDDRGPFGHEDLAGSLAEYNLDRGTSGYNEDLASGSRCPTLTDCVEGIDGNSWDLMGRLTRGTHYFQTDEEDAALELRTANRDATSGSTSRKGFRCVYPLGG